jgi:2-polyprenyl-6-methoxyphenol hydroxylase-like FAD-dependent oxidoreductase
VTLLPSPIDCPVIIVGGGPVGLTLSLDLSRRGIRHIVFSDIVGTSLHPKCNLTNARSMEHFRRLGIAQQIRFGGLRADYPSDIVYFTRLGRTEVARIRFPSPQEAISSRAAPDSRWPTPEPPHRISQIYLERVLHRAADECDSATVLQGHRFERYTEYDDGVLVDVVEVETGRLKQYGAKWLVGCDGGRSAVRRCTGLQLLGTSNRRREIFGGTMLATYYRSEDLKRILSGREGFMYWTLNPDIRSVTVTIDGDERFLTHVQLADGADPDAIVFSDVLSRIVGRRVSCEVLSKAAWNAGFELVAERYSRGRAFLAGDAAHLFTPTGGFGMNTGIDDVGNLAWKLAACERRWGGAGLLASYDEERRPVGIRNTHAASQIADVISGFRIPVQIEADGAMGEQARAQAARLILGVNTEEFDTVGVQLGVRYEGSPIIVADGTAAPPDLRTRYEVSGRPGGRLPHFYVDGDTPIFDKLGMGFTLINFAGCATVRDCASAAAARQGIPLTHVMVSAAAAREVLGADLLLVRPDQHIAWRGGVSGTDFEAIFSRLRGAAVASR